MVRKAVSGLGRTLVTAGVILLLFVAYQLWGTGINTARAQESLGKQLSAGFDDVPQDLVNGSPVVTAPSSDAAAFDSTLPGSTLPVSTLPASTLPGSTLPASTVPASTLLVSTLPASTLPTVPSTTKYGRELVTRKTSKQVPLRNGEAVGQLVIPRISVNKAIVQGTSVEALKKGPGHYKTTPFPGEEGNSAIACHRTTYGGPCFRLDELKPGDPIFVARKDAKGNAQWFRYNVYNKVKVKPSSNEVLLPQGDRNTLTLTTCDPQYSAKQRLVVHAELVGPAVEGDLIDVSEDPLSEEYKRQVEAKSRPAPTAAAPTTALPLIDATFEDPVVGETIPQVAAAVDVGPDTAPPNVTTDTLADDSTASSLVAEAPRFDGERSSGTLYKFAFFAGTAAAWLHTLAWALACAAIWLLVWLAVHRRTKATHRWTAYGFGFVLLFAPALYFWFENVSRLLPEAV